MPLADVMEERGDVCLLVEWERGGDAGRHVECMPLIGGVLRPEQRGTRIIQPIVNLLLFVRIES